MKIEIKARAYLDGKVLFTAYIPDNTEPEFKMRAALQIAVKARADLSGADLSGADLSGADLTGADLSGADLTRADLSGADLSGADLSGADLSGADLTGADLSDADLTGADLTGADLTDADLTDAKNLPMPSPEEIMRLDEVREIVLKKPQRLKMSGWHFGEWTPEHTPEEEHKCGSAHCIAGWLQALSPDQKVRQMDPEVAGRMLAPASAYMFTASDSRALQWLKDRGYARMAEAAK